MEIHITLTFWQPNFNFELYWGPTLLDTKLNQIFMISGSFGNETPAPQTFYDSPQPHIVRLLREPRHLASAAY